MRSRPMRRVGGVALAFSSIVLVLLGAEALVRALAPGWKPRVAERALFWQHHPTLGWAHRPAVRGRFSGPGWETEVQINSRGLRDVEHDESPAGRPRQLLLGDSFGWGFGVSREEGVAGVLQALCPGWETINASVSGYSTDQEYLYYRDEGSRYRPERVLLLIHENDLPGNSAHRMYGYEKPRFVATADGLELANVPVRERLLWERAYGWLTSRSYLANGLLRRRGIGLMLEFGQPWGAGELPVDAIVTPRILTRFARELGREEIDLHWALVPMAPPTASELRRLGARLGVPVLDLGPAFERAQRGGLETTLPGDVHWNAAGHRLAGEALAAHLGCRE